MKKYMDNCALIDMDPSGHTEFVLSFTFTPKSYAILSLMVAIPLACP